MLDLTSQTHALDSHNRETIWTIWRVSLLERLWIEGLTCSQIAEQLGCGITRNAIIGKVSRLGLNQHYPRKRNPNSQRRMRPVSPEQVAAREARVAMRAARLLIPKKTARLPEASLQSIEMNPCSLVELDAHRCHWPVGDPALPSFHFCGAPPREGRSYCAAHHQIAYARPATKRKDSRSVPFLQHGWGGR